MALAARKIEPAAPLPEEIRERIAKARIRLGELTARQMTLAEQSLQTPAVEKEYAAVVAEMMAVSGDVERLELALTGMERRAAQKLEADQAAEQTALRQRVAKILDQRVTLAGAFEAAIGEAVATFRQLVDASDKAMMAWPGRPPEFGAAFTNDELSALVSAEMFRLSGVTVVTGRPPSGGRALLPLPAPRPPSLEFTGQPDRVKPLAVAIEEANTFAKSQLGV